MREQLPEVAFNAVPAQAGGMVFVIHGWQVTPALAIHRHYSMWAVSSLNGVSMMTGIKRRAAAIEVARAIEQIAIAHNVPLAGNHEEWKTLPAWQQFMSDMLQLRRVRNNGDHEVTLNGVLDDYPGSEALQHYVRWHDYDPIKYAEGEKGSDGSAWTDVSKEWIEDALDSLTKGESLVFAFTQYDTDHAWFEDAIHAWVADDQHGRESKINDFLRVYKRKDRRAGDYYRLASKKGWDMARFDEIIELVSKPWQVYFEDANEHERRMSKKTLAELPPDYTPFREGEGEMVRVARLYVEAQWEAAESREFLRELMREDGWGVLFTDDDQSNVFERRTQIVEQLRAAADYVSDVRNDNVWAVGVTVKRVWRNWYGQLEEAQDVSTTYNGKGVASEYVIDSLWGIEMSHKRESDAYLGEVMDEMVPDSPLPTSPEDAYFSTFAG